MVYGNQWLSFENILLPKMLLTKTESENEVIKTLIRGDTENTISNRPICFCAFKTFSSKFNNLKVVRCTAVKFAQMVKVLPSEKNVVVELKWHLKETPFLFIYRNLVSFFIREKMPECSLVCFLITESHLPAHHSEISPSASKMFGWIEFRKVALITL